MESTNQQTGETTKNTSLVDLQLRPETLEFILWALQEISAPHKITNSVLIEIKTQLEKK